ncbi:hypothetical protein CspeluHIS016_0104390 [Cutaneotrichosporon spelunceum]|uniref:Ubiquitin carboxyl-terminal hydrolase n=1 Tax=Cutaneotrichosporon spelunceum TaxID=1672016 RepID=A0AAD3TNL1_9TREE|nr:hypothetical protein CspeluHIS016_0104390 [Cutaneotrichosporon spelunceum]
MDKWRRFGMGSGNAATANGSTPTAPPLTESPPPEPKGKERALEEGLWGLENFGNTCYCNSILQALYASQPFRAFIEAYPDISEPYNALGGKIATEPIRSPSPEPAKPNSAEPATAAHHSTKEKRSGLLGLGKSKDKQQPAKAAPVPVQQQQQQLPPPIILPADPSFPEMTLLATVQTLFHHMSTSLPHHPVAPKKSPSSQQSNGEAAAPPPSSVPASASNSATTVVQLGPNGLPLGPSLLASLPPPSCVRGGGPYHAGSLGRGVVRPEDVLRTARRHNGMFGGQQQQDAHEFLGFVLNQLAEEVERLDAKLKERGQEVTNFKERGMTFIHSLFHGVLVNETRCLNCETTSSREESFLDLSIDIEQHSSLTACLRQFSHSEMLCSTNKFYCETCCGLVEAQRRMRIKSLPNILGLHLKRFRQDDMGRLHKLFYRVTFPLSLRVPCTTEETEKAERLYELFAVVVHIGNGPTHGHYVTVVRSEDGWVMCDDENVEPISEDELTNYFGDNITGAGYVLFYQAVELNLLSLGLKKLPVPKVRPQMPAELVEEAKKVLEPVSEPSSTPVTTAPPTPAIPSPAYVPSPVTPASPAVPVAPIPIPSPALVAAGPSPSHLSTPSNRSTAGTPNGSSRREASSTSSFLTAAFMEHNSPARRREPSISRSVDKSNRWSILKRKDDTSRVPLLRQGTATTLGTLGTDNASNSSMHHDSDHTPHDMNASVISSLSAVSAPSALTGPSPSNGTGGSSPTPASVSSSMGLSPSPSTRAERSASGMSSSNGYGGGSSLGRKISDRANLTKLSRNTSSGWKMGFGKKGKVDE